MSHSPKPAGTVLVVVMVVIVLLTYACYRFVDRTKVEDMASRTRSELVQLAVTLDSGEEQIRALAASWPSERVKLGGIYDNRSLFCGRPVSGDQNSPQRSCFTVLAPRLKGEEVSGLRYGLVNESSKLSLGALLQWDRVQPGAARLALLQLPGMEAATADALLDWIDPDGTPRESGAEADDYHLFSDGTAQSMPPNALPRRLDELLPVRGMRRRLLFGLDRNENYHVSGSEQMENESAVGSEPMEVAPAEGLPWIYYLTPYAAERNLSFDGRQRIYLNDPDLRRLSNLLTNRYSQEWAQFVIAYRRFGTVDGRAVRAPEVSVTGGPDPALRGEGNEPKQPRHFRIASLYDLVGASVQLQEEHGTPGPIISSPLPDQSEVLRRDLLKLADGLTTDQRPVLPGRVNINEAPMRVLLAVPGINQELANQIAEARADPDQLPTARYFHEAWLLAEGLVTARQMAALDRVVTTRGAVFRCQITSFIDRDTLALRSELVIDGTQSPPRAVDRRDLRRLGRGYSLDVLLAGRLSSIEEGQPFDGDDLSLEGQDFQFDGDLP